MIFEAHIKILEDGTRVIQTVKEHSDSVASKASDYVSNLKLENTGKLLGRLHDIGKLTEDFSRYINDESEFRRGEIDHSYAGAKYIMENLKGSLSAAFNIHNEKIDAILLGHVIVAHHGLKDWVDLEGNGKFEERISKTDRYNEIIHNLSELYSSDELTALYTQAVIEIDSYINRIVAFCKANHKQVRNRSEDTRKTSCAFYIGLLERLLESVLVDADRTDTIEFSIGKSIEFSSNSFKWEKARITIEHILNSFPKKMNDITLLRQDISNRCVQFSNHEVGICKLIVPTGGGKTLASMRFAINYCINYDKERIFYIAPYMSILEQNSAILRNIFGDENFLEHHSNVIFGEDEENRMAEYELHADQWDSPVIATTVVQFLNTIFSSKMDSVRRFHQLTNAVIIVDEAQSIPDKCIYIFNLAMNFLAHFCKSTIVLCTATQPSLGNLKYPLITDLKESMTGQFYREDFKRLKRNEIVIPDKMKSYTNEEAAVLCIERFKTEGSVLFIVNTKKTASEIYKLVKEKSASLNVAVIHISTNMCPAHRKEKIQEVRALLYAKSPVICITTQLIEAGVDISFPCVIRSWAGLDNAAQAAGRCNRNGEISDICNVYLIRLLEEKLCSLTEIKTAQTALDTVLYSFRECELLQTAAIDRYFNEYFRNRKDELGYKIMDGTLNSSVLKLLSDNSDRVGQKKDNRNIYNSQAFKTAGTKFQVINEDTFDVLVPYNDIAKDIIADFYSWSGLQNTRKLLKDSQQYVVSIYDQVKRQLEKNGGLEKVIIGTSGDYVLILKPEFYDNDYGINLEGKADSSLLFWG